MKKGLGKQKKKKRKRLITKDQTAFIGESNT